ncbi:MAG: lipopolysaccharide biosynthesis protein [Bacteroidaceae bacterium]|nr:lipopolysaccharide biosynthesis protein [Bacteroidaceae bacterium]
MANGTKTNTLFKGLSIQTLVTIMMGVLEITYFAVMSRLLTKADFGYFAAISGVMAISMSMSDAGLGSAVIQKKDASEKHVSTAFSLSCIMGVFFSVLLFLLSPWIANIIADETLVLPLQIMSSTILMHSLISVGNALLYRKLNFRRIGLNSVCSYFLSSCIGVVLAYNGFGLMSIIYANILYSVFTLILLFGFCVRFPKWGIYKEERKGIVSFGGWLTIGVVLNNISHQLDKLVLSKWLSVEVLGAYNRPAGFVSTISSKINGIFDTVLFPMLADMQDNKEKVKSVFIRAVSLLNSFSAVLAIAFLFNSELIINIFFGSEWLNIIPIMQIVSLSVIFNINSRLVDCFFRSLNYVKLGTILRFLGVFLTLGCLYIGVHYGILGVAWGLFVSNVSLVIIKMIVLCLKTESSLFEMFKCWLIAWKPAVIPTITGAVYMCLPHSVFINLVFASIFGTIVFVEFVIFPKMISREYCMTVYPMITKFVKKLKKRP